MLLSCFFNYFAASAGLAFVAVAADAAANAARGQAAVTAFLVHKLFVYVVEVLQPAAVRGQ